MSHCSTLIPQRILVIEHVLPEGFNKASVKFIGDRLPAQGLPTSPPNCFHMQDLTCLTLELIPSPYTGYMHVGRRTDCPHTNSCRVIISCLLILCQFHVITLDEKKIIFVLSNQFSSPSPPCLKNETPPYTLIAHGNHCNACYSIPV